eukprot:UN16678
MQRFLEYIKTPLSDNLSLNSIYLLIPALFPQYFQFSASILQILYQNCDNTKADADANLHLYLLLHFEKRHMNVFIYKGTFGNKDFEIKINTSRCRVMIIFEIQLL